MNYKLLLVAGVAALSYGYTASAEMAPYVGIKAGVAFEKADPKGVKKISKTQFVGSAEVGLAFKLPAGALRAEIEYSYHPEFEGKQSGIPVEGTPITFDNKMKIKQHTFMLNAYYDLPVKWAVVPYVGGGIGYNRVTIEDKISNVQGGTYDGGDKVKTTKGLFAWNIGAGLGYNVTKNFALDLGYRYMSTSDFKKQGAKVSLYNHQIYAGLRYTF